MTKSCPIRNDLDCLEEDCAWFYGFGGACAIQALGVVSTELGAVVTELAELRDEVRRLASVTVDQVF